MIPEGMNMTTPDSSSDCPQCGVERGEGENHTRAFVTYQPSLNDAQADCDWSDDLPELEGNVCMNCGYVIHVFDPRDLDVVDGGSDE